MKIGGDISTTVGRISAAVAAAPEQPSARSAEGAATSSDKSKSHVSLPKPAAASGGASNPGIEQLKKTIERLKKQLAELQKQLADAVRRASAKDPSAQSIVMSLQSQVASISGALQKATAALAELMLKSGATTGMVNTQA
ncbi:hypothetical protein [Dyella silvatica]|uniref:hypothetical protein n=1 Tax=Dyella silvatica TaxID=2992128 RepID=UPI00225AD42E|nr:hypothetical protein [Dyella silvatica]